MRVDSVIWILGVRWWLCVVVNDGSVCDGGYVLWFMVVIVCVLVVVRSGFERLNSQVRDD